MTTAPDPRRRNEKSHRAIVTAALDLCVERGYGQVTMEAIAAQAGVSKKTIYRWWPSKGAVVLEGIAELVGEVTPFLDTGDIVADLTTQLTAVLDHMMTGPRSAVYAGVIAESHHDRELVGALSAMVGPRIEAARERLRRAREQGQLAADADVDLIIDLLYGPLYYRLLLHLEPYSPERIRMVIERTLAVFAPPAE
ncbi:TetR/AcrR family transcriptional regulator [Actinomadura hibisca]|uniref:TetR/AcrR family transcriptional regulator n=1 Tax=Actinomadura hibisca TaxID=68565 RepID=UPI00082CAAAA|nr:TetR/AcrR family transcriptional regulator [Actinomadura hibisca]